MFNFQKKNSKIKTFIYNLSITILNLLLLILYITILFAIVYYLQNMKELWNASTFGSGHSTLNKLQQLFGVFGFSCLIVLIGISACFGIISLKNWVNS
jgi:Signal transduction histidine kinase involved in nitrogen fixation and metabolism regulation